MIFDLFSSARGPEGESMSCTYVCTRYGWYTPNTSTQANSQHVSTAQHALTEWVGGPALYITFSVLKSFLHLQDEICHGHNP